MCDRDLLLIAGVLIVLISASYQDHKHREVHDIHWWIIGSMGVISVMSDAQGVHGIMMATASAMIAIGILWLDTGRMMGTIYWIITMCLFLIPISFSSDDCIVRMGVCIMVSSITFYLMYVMGILRGGADAKCMIVMSIAFHRDVSSYCLTTMAGSNMPFTMSLLFYATLFTSLYALSIIIGNLLKRDIGFRPWRRMELEEAKGSHVWLKQDVVDEKVVITRGVADEGAYDRLGSKGIKEVLVTPMIPFIIPITMAFVFIILAGDPLWSMISSLC